MPTTLRKIASPGVAEYEEHAYWRDVGTIDGYFEAHRDTLGEQPRFTLFNPQWLINFSNYQGPSARIRNSVLRREIIVEPDVEIDDCIIMHYSVIRRGYRLKEVIVNCYNDIPPNTVIGHDQAADRTTYHVSEGGIVVLTKRTEVPDVTCY